MKTLLTLLLSIFIGSSVLAQHENEHHQHSSHLDTLMAAYMDAKDALVQDDFEAAKEKMYAFAAEVKGSHEMQHHEAHAAKHAEHHSAMMQAVAAAEGAEDLKSLRAAFRDISEQFIKAVENQGYDEKLFVQYCPMVEDGYWLSKKEEVENPYFGTSMPTCGGVEKVIE